MISCIIIDDELAAISILEEYIEKTSFLELTKSFRDPIVALTFCQQNTIDLIFLDINMPNLNGLQFYRALGQKPMVIFTTAYSEFAVESYEVKALDYLLKPISFSRFMSAASKAIEKHASPKSTDALPEPEQNDNTIYIKSGRQLHKIDLATIIFIQKEGHYLVFHTKEKKILSRMNMKQVFDVVPEKDFIQIHKSFVIAWSHIDVIETHQVIINKQRIPIGVRYRENFQKIIVLRSGDTSK